jgi:hypothetical protein
MNIKKSEQALGLQSTPDAKSTKSLSNGDTNIRKKIIDQILAKQDGSSRWGYNAKQAREHPEYMYYSPNFKSTLWTLVLLADIKAPAGIAQIEPSIRLIMDHFYDPEHGIFSLPGMRYFPIPCLNGNMIYLHQYFETNQPELVDKTIAFFSSYQRFDDGGFKTPGSYPYCANKSCYGRHTCYWGVTKLLKGISFIPKNQRGKDAQQLINQCIDFVLQHEVCFRSHHSDQLLRSDIDKLTFPNFYKSDFLEILWLLSREEVQDQSISRALELLRSKRKSDGSWELEKSMNTVVPVGQKGCANAFITERANEVLNFYGHG